MFRLEEEWLRRRGSFVFASSIGRFQEIKALQYPQLRRSVAGTPLDVHSSGCFFVDVSRNVVKT